MRTRCLIYVYFQLYCQTFFARIGASARIQIIHTRTHASQMCHTCPANMSQMCHIALSTAPTDRYFSRIRSEGSRFIWGCGGEAVFAERCVCVRKRSQPFATVRNRPQPFATVRNRPRDRPRHRRKALHRGECAWSDPESVSS